MKKETIDQVIKNLEDILDTTEDTVIGDLALESLDAGGQ